MQLKTIFNRVTNDKPFVVDHVQFAENDSTLSIELTMRRVNCATCNAKVIAKKVPHAIHILDRFHIMHRQVSFLLLGVLAR
ncbi:transposase [Novipirellula artificiosorum]|uniref:Transposase n=1 Tax=Novipirellula artificiosorum TaxID=2528016 RepID=A0A5C6DKL9_9BACT|nr:transposase [Novipirellula artificiosorum]TWU37132.1 hypothetical protein Poly41_32590 [Novipirellula artificiosorum]